MPFKVHPFFKDPPVAQKLWRYISIEKFRSLIEREALFFCRADKFPDAFEGSLPEKDYQYRPQSQKLMMEALGGKWDIEGNVRALSSLQRHKRTLTIINCWHHNEHESEAMWNIYLKDNNGVAIQTTCTGLKESLEKTSYEVNVGTVRYLNYKEDVFFDGVEFPHEGYNLTTPFIHKRNYFQFEQEYRAIISLPEPEGAIPYEKWKDQWKNEEEEFEDGKLVDIHLNDFLEQVVLAPGADASVREEVVLLLNSKNIQVPVVKSSMDELPLF